MSGVSKIVANTGIVNKNHVYSAIDGLQSSGLIKFYGHDTYNDIILLQISETTSVGRSWTTPAELMTTASSTMLTFEHVASTGDDLSWGII